MRHLFASISIICFASQPVLAQVRSPLEVVAEMEIAPGNITVTPDGAIVTSLHQLFDPAQAVVEVRESGELLPFPDRAWNDRTSGESAMLDTVLGIQADPQGRVWMLDNGMRGQLTPKLVAWDTRGDRLDRVIYLPPPVTVDGSFVNDLAVDLTHNYIYIADPAPGDRAALIVVDLSTGVSRRVLQGDRSVVAEDVQLAIDGVPLTQTRPDGTVVSPRVGVNPIALDGADEWLYFGPMHGTSLYRVRTSDLRDRALADAELSARVERYSDKPICDGISIDREGNIYITDLAANAIGVITGDRRYQLLVTSDRLSWPDAFSFGPDGYLYAIANQLQHAPAFNAGDDRSRSPFYIFRLKPLAPGIVGR
jgi:sugar lactone lactonase YvrE